LQSSLEDLMNSVRTACLGLATLATISCSAIAPVRITAGDQCFRCRRYISDVRTAAETIDSNRFVSKFRGPGCMAKYLASHPDEKSTVYVTDFTTGKLIAPAAAFYVAEVVDRKTGETDYRAYHAKAEADADAAQTHATPITWDTVLEKAR
jgi:hypothetical protein